jgi:polyhydroxyalkanoate synthesis regulator phasin
MEDLFKKTVSFGIGLFDYTKEKVEKLVDEMVKRGEVNKQDSTKAVEELWERARQEQSDFWNKIKGYVKNIVDEMAVPSKADFKALEDRVAALEKRVRELEGQPLA